MGLDLARGAYDLNVFAEIKRLNFKSEVIFVCCHMLSGITAARTLDYAPYPAESHRLVGYG